MKLLLLAFALLLSTTTFAQDYEEFGPKCSGTDPKSAPNEADALSADFVPMVEGTSASDGWTVYKRSCLVQDPITKTCIKREERQAKGSLVVGKLIRRSGSFYCWEWYDPANGGSGKAYSSSMYFQFPYRGETRAEKKINGIKVDHPWGRLRPEGRIDVSLCAGSKTNFKLNYKFRASAGHPDAPNNYMRDYVASKLKPVFADYLARVLNNEKIAIVVDDNGSCM